MLIGGSNGSVRLWDDRVQTALLRPDVFAPRPGIRGLGQIGDRWLVTVASRKAAQSSTELRVFDLKRARPDGEVQQIPRLRTANLDVSDDGRFMTIGTWDGRVELWATPREPGDTWAAGSRTCW